MKKLKINIFPLSLLFIQPIFMASNLVVARGGVEFVPPISLAFWRWTVVFLILLPFTYVALRKNFDVIKKEYKKLFFLGSMGCGVCGAFPFLAGETTTVTNMGIIYTSSPVFIILISYFFFKEKINLTKIIGLITCLIGVLIIIIKGNFNLLINLQFTIGDLWMLAAAIGWALYSIYLFYWNSKLKIFERFTLISFFGALSLLPFYIGEEIFYKQTAFIPEFYFWVIFAAISPGIIAFTLYTITQKKLGASLTGFTLYIFTVYGAIYGYFLFDDELTINIEKVKISTDDDIELLGWYHEKDLKKNKTILFFHGNAGSLENRIHKLNHFHEMDVNFLIIAWRGFSGNKGKPSEKGLYEDGRSAIKWLFSKGVKEENIVLYGESLGTGVATHLSQKKNFAGIILETPFTSMIDAAKKFYPYIPVGLLLKDKFDNKSKIKNITVPVLIMHGEADQIVPFYMGKKMYEIANEPKYSYFTKHDNHMMEYDENLIKALNSFLANLD